MMKSSARGSLSRFASSAFVAAIALAAATPADSAPTLLGDTVLIGRYVSWPGPFAYGPFSVVVQAGDADKTAVSSGNNLYVNVEADRVRIDFGPSNGAGGGMPAPHEILIEDIDWVGDVDATIAGYSLVTNIPTVTYAPYSNIATVTSSRVRVGADFVGFTINNLEFQGTEGYYVEILLTSSSIPVSEPSMVALVAIGLAGIASERRRRRPKAPRGATSGLQPTD